MHECTREGVSEALTGERTGQPLSRERSEVPGADMVLSMEGNTNERVMRAPVRPGVVEDTGMCGSSLYGNREILGSPMATSNSPTCGHSNSPRQDGWIMSRWRC